MPPAAIEFRLDELSSLKPCIDDGLDRVTRNCRMIDERDQQGISPGAYLLDPARDRYAHFAFRIIIEGKGDIRILQMLTHLIRAMTNDNNNFIDGCVAKIRYT